MAGPGAFARRRGTYVVGANPMAFPGLCVTASAPRPAKRGHPLGDCLVAAYRLSSEEPPQPPRLDAMRRRAVHRGGAQMVERSAADEAPLHGRDRRPRGGEKVGREWGSEARP